MLLVCHNWKFQTLNCHLSGSFSYLMQCIQKKKNHMQIFAANQPVSALAQSFRSADWAPHSCYKPNWLSHSLDITGGDHMGTTAHHTHTHTHTPSLHSSTHKHIRNKSFTYYYYVMIRLCAPRNQVQPGAAVILHSISSHAVNANECCASHIHFTVARLIIWDASFTHCLVFSMSRAQSYFEWIPRRRRTAELFYWYDLCRHSELLNWILTKTNKFDDCVVVISKDFFGVTIKKANIIQMLMWFVSIKVLLVHATLNRVRCKFLCQNQQCAQHGDPNACDEKKL